MRGRRPNPRSDKKLLGFPGKRKGESLTDAVPEAEGNLAIIPPARLKKTKGAVEIWREMLTSLPVSLQPHQVPAFTDMVICFARLQACENLIEKQGLTVEGTRGTIKNPLLMVCGQYRASAQRWAGEFYLTAAATERLAPKKPEKKRRGILNGEFVN